MWFWKYCVDSENSDTKVSNIDKSYRSKKFKNDYDHLKKQMSEILKAGKSHMISQKRVLRTSLRILNTKSLSKLKKV